MSENPTIAVGLPSGDMVHKGFLMSMLAVGRATPGRILFIDARSSIIGNVRNQCVDGAQKYEAKWLFMCDSDMVVPYDALVRLMNHNKSIIGAVYMNRMPPYHVHGKALDNRAELPTSGLLEMSVLPAGCLLINMEVFQLLKKPYFRTPPDEVSGHNIGEDYDFCARARAAGYSIWADMDLSMEVGHIGQYIFGHESHERARERNAA